VNLQNVEKLALSVHRPRRKNPSNRTLLLGPLLQLFQKACYALWLVGRDMGTSAYALKAFNFNSLLLPKLLIKLIILLKKKLPIILAICNLMSAKFRVDAHRGISRPTGLLWRQVQRQSLSLGPYLQLF
jgi:hypothetical protein